MVGVPANVMVKRPVAAGTAREASCVREERLAPAILLVSELVSLTSIKSPPVVATRLRYIDRLTVPLVGAALVSNCRKFCRTK